MSPTNTFRLFVYGTLKRDGCRHAGLSAQRFLRVAHTLPHYALFDLGAYPGLVSCPEGGQTVHGELYLVERSLLPWLDRVEGAPLLYQLGPVLLEDESEPAHAYFYQRDTAGHPRLASGRWHNVPGEE